MILFLLFYFSFLDMYQTNHRVGCHAAGINSSLMFFSYTSHISWLKSITLLESILLAKVMSSLENTGTSSFQAFYSSQTNQEKNFMLADNHRQLYHTFIGFLYLLRQHFSINGTLEATLSHISWVLYQSELNTKGQVITALSYICWIM